MLQLIIPDSDELWDEKKEEFVYRKGQTLQLEHSLVSLAKWESKWCVPFLSKKDKTLEETLDYIKCMTITQNVNPEVYLNLTQENVDAVNAYAVMRLDEDGHPFDIRVRAEREAAEREFCSCCFPGWFKNGGTTKTA